MDGKNKNKRLDMKLIKTLGGLAVGLTLATTCYSNSAASSSWVDFTGAEQIPDLVSAQDDRGEGKASPMCQYYHDESSDYSQFHGLGYVKQKSNDDRNVLMDFYI